MASTAENASSAESRQSKQSDLAKSVLTHQMSPQTNATNANMSLLPEAAFPPTSSPQKAHLAPPPSIGGIGRIPHIGMYNGVGHPLSDTPYASFPSTASNSPRLMPIRQNSGDSTPRLRPHPSTLNIPGLTMSKASPDGKISKRDVSSKLVIIMVGLPARGKSYITKKMHRYLSWQQHETRIFNVGNRRRVAAGIGTSSAPGSTSALSPQKQRAQSLKVDETESLNGTATDAANSAHAAQAARIILHGVDSGSREKVVDDEAESASENKSDRVTQATTSMDQTADFFDPQNTMAAAIREAVAISTLDELLAFILEGDGSVGILDATNSTIARRQKLFNHIKEREPKLGILFVESVCEDEKLLEANMRLKLRGPDYKDKDPESSYEDFKLRVAAYESAYEPLGEYEEKNNMQYIKMIDVGRKVVHHQLSGFLAGGIASYLSTFNLSPRQIWITRHGKSKDNQIGKLGGDSDLTESGILYAQVLYNFVTVKRKEWEVDQRNKIMQLENMPVPQRPGDNTPPYPELLGDLDTKNFCVWTSMLKRSVQTAAFFDEDEDYDVKNWAMLNELNAGMFEGLTYEEIAKSHPEEYAKRTINKLTYIYPGVGGEGYLQVIGRLKDMVREIERIKDHVLIIGHRSVSRVLMAYFMDLTRDDIADLDVPLGMLFVIEPKPYGIDFHAYKYNEQQQWFDELPNYKPQKETEKGN